MNAEKSQDENTTKGAAKKPSGAKKPSEKETVASPQLSPSEMVAAAVLDAAGGATVGIGRDSRGVGVVVAPNRVLTNAHNLRDRTTTVNFGTGHSEPATLIAVDQLRDLVVLDVPTGDVAPIRWSDRAVRYGTTVFVAVRTPSGIRLTRGEVSNPSRSIRGPQGRPIDSVIEHTAPLAKGSSGSVLLDELGEAVGLNTHRIGHGFYAAQAANERFQNVVSRLIGGTSVEPVSLGVEVAPPQVANRLRTAVGLEPRDGLLIRSVLQGSPADQAGLAEGDLLVAANSTDLSSVASLHQHLRTLEYGQETIFEILRGAEQLSVTVRFHVEEAAE